MTINQQLTLNEQLAVATHLMSLQMEPFVTPALSLMGRQRMSAAVATLNAAEDFYQAGQMTPEESLLKGRRSKTVTGLRQRCLRPPKVSVYSRIPPIAA